MAADLGPLKVVAAIKRMYPDGALFLTRYGRRVEQPALVPWRRGYKANVNGETHWFTNEGEFVAAGDQAIPSVLSSPGAP